MVQQPSDDAKIYDIKIKGIRADPSTAARLPLEPRWHQGGWYNGVPVAVVDQFDRLEVEMFPTK